MNTSFFKESKVMVVIFLRSHTCSKPSFYQSISIERYHRIRRFDWERVFSVFSCRFWFQTITWINELICGYMFSLRRKYNQQRSFHDIYMYWMTVNVHDKYSKGARDDVVFSTLTFTIFLVSCNFRHRFYCVDHMIFWNQQIIDCFLITNLKSVMFFVLLTMSSLLLFLLLLLVLFLSVLHLATKIISLAQMHENISWWIPITIH